MKPLLTLLLALLSLQPTMAEGLWKQGNISYDLYTDGLAVVRSITADCLRGGDITMLTYVENLGAKFYDAAGKQKDALDIMQENGVNTVRLRVYNNPGQQVSYPGWSGTMTYRLPAGYANKADMLRLAKRAKDHHMKIELTLHYSDFWTNGEMQFIPKDWQGHTIQQLQQDVYSYTHDILQTMTAQGTPPDYVSLGNEIQNGLLFNYYTDPAVATVPAASASGSSATVPVASATAIPANGIATAANKRNLSALLNSGAKAVREVCPQAKIILHFTLSTNINESTYHWLLGNASSNDLGLAVKGSPTEVDFDIVGASYYPFWTEQKPSMLTTLANNIYKRYAKELLIMEVGYSWSQYRPSGRYGGNYEGQLHLNGSIYNEATKQGQKTFMQEVQKVVSANPHILGYLYWDPVMVEQQIPYTYNGKTSTYWMKSTWAERLSGTNWYEDGNQVGNTTWFDYSGKALPIFDAIRDNATIVPPTVTFFGKQYTVVPAPDDTPPGSAALLGDVNHDGIINHLDAHAISDLYLGRPTSPSSTPVTVPVASATGTPVPDDSSSGSTTPAADLNHDGSITIDDANILINLLENMMEK